jgi:hypothetical protein
MILKLKFKSLFLLLLASLLVLATVSVSATGLNGDLSDTIDVNVHVDSYAAVDNDDIGATDWLDYTGGDDFVYYLQGLISEGTLDEVIPTSGGSTFTGDGDEEKWAAKYITMSSNVPFEINATATYLTGTSEEGSLNEQLTNTSDMVYYYLFPVSGSNSPITITPEGTTETTVGQSGSLGFAKGSQTFVLASKIKMPNNFWEVESGTYTGTVIFTVEAH